jgi:hypothetical protein
MAQLISAMERGGAEGEGEAGGSSEGHEMFDALRPVIEQLIEQALQTRLTHIQKANKGQVAEQSPTAPDEVGLPDLSQARRAKDGFSYVPDPSRPGKFLRIVGA